METRFRKHATIVGSLALLATPAHAGTVIASADARGRGPNSPTIPDSTATSNLAIGPVDGSDEYFRSFLTFDLTSESVATGTTTLTLSGSGFGSGSDEDNTTALAQTFTLYSLGSDWNNAAAPGPAPGTILDMTDLTVATGDDTQDLIFGSTGLTTVFNDAFNNSDPLYLGISSSGESSALGTRSFKWFGSTEDSGAEPVISYTAIPEPSSALVLGGFWLLALLHRRR